MAKYLLSPPPSANALFYNVSGAGRRKTRQYQSWIKNALKELMVQRARPFEGCAKVTITLPKSRGDADNKIKPTLDLLVRAEILRDDSPSYVSAVTVTFGDVQQMEVEIAAA